MLCLTSTITAQIRYLDIMDKAPKSLPIYQINCNRVTISPIVNGELSDEAWKQAKKITNFKINDHKELQGKPASRQTEIYTLHDGRYLYIGFVCHEPDMSCVRAENTRFDFPDILYDDRIEILLDTKHDHKNLARLVVNSLGVTYDTELCRPVQFALSYQKGSDNWNTEWRAKVKRYEDRWTGEIAIAIDRFSENGIVAGDTWGINIARDSHATFGDFARFAKVEKGRELSALIPVRSMVMGKFSDRWIEPILYADLVFDQNRLQVDTLQFHEAYANYNGSIWNKPQFFGDNPLSIKVKNVSGKTMRINSSVTTKNYDGTKIVDQKTFAIDPNKEQTLEAIIKIRDHDRQPFDLTLTDTDGGQKLYQTSYDTRIPPFVEFDLSSVYLSDGDIESDRNIYISPVTVVGTMSNSSIKLKLNDANGNTLATDILESPTEYKFTRCFDKLDVRSLSSGNYTINCLLIDKSTGDIIGNFDQLFTKGSSTKNPVLSASYEPYSFGGRSGKSITVKFPQGEKFIFWEHASYIPWWDLDNMAVTYEFMECWGYANQGCNEPMQDKENRYSKPEIIENSPARVVVLWRYALSDPNYQIMFKEWVNEYYYLYPDGSGVREVCLWANSNIPHEVLQPQYIFPTGVIPKQMFKDTVSVVFNMNGDELTSLIDKPILEDPESTGKWSEEIMRIYLKDRKHPYLVWSQNNGLFDRPINKSLIKGDAVRSIGGHWPMQKLNVDVYSIIGTHQPYHSWLGALQAEVDADKTPNRWAHLIGLTDKPNSYITRIADNWLNPVTPKLTNAKFEKFDAIQKAYVLNVDKTKDCTITFDKLDAKPLINPVFIFKGAMPKSITMKINGKVVADGSYKYANITHEHQSACLLWSGKTIGRKDVIKMEFTY